MNFRLWLKADIQSLEIEVCSTPRFGHSSFDKKSGHGAGPQCIRAPGTAPCNSSTARNIRRHTAQASGSPASSNPPAFRLRVNLRHCHRSLALGHVAVLGRVLAFRGIGHSPAGDRAVAACWRA
jgi:hypothetical protein